MALVLKNYPIAFVLNLKVASSSVKSALYELEYGKAWENYRDRNGAWIHIHNGWMGIDNLVSITELKASGYYVFCIVRDPIDRVLSAYTNRVRYYRELRLEVMNPDVVARHNLTPDPDLSTFLDKFEAYREASSEILRHTRPQVDFIGSDLSPYSRIFKIEDGLESVAAGLSEIAGKPVRIDHIQKSRDAVHRDSLYPRQLRRLTNFYRKDYRVLFPFYTEPILSLTTC